MDQRKDSECAGINTHAKELLEVDPPLGRGDRDSSWRRNPVCTAILLIVADTSLPILLDGGIGHTHGHHSIRRSGGRLRVGCRGLGLWLGCRLLLGLR